MPELNKEAIAEWVAALRSGEYKQGRGALKQNGQYCCLGVACDIFADRVGLKEVPPESEGGDFGYWYATDDEIEGEEGRLIERAVLPPTVAKFLGFGEDDTDADIETNPGDATSLTQLNDALEYDFKQIALIIEHYFLNDEEVSLRA